MRTWEEFDDQLKDPRTGALLSMIEILGLSPWCLVGNGGMDPYSSPYVIPNSNFICQLGPVFWLDGTIAADTSSYVNWALPSGWMVRQTTAARMAGATMLPNAPIRCIDPLM